MYLQKHFLLTNVQTHMLIIASKTQMKGKLHHTPAISPLTIYLTKQIIEKYKFFPIYYIKFWRNII